MKQRHQLSELAQRCHALFDQQDGSFARSIKNFCYRPQQIEMMHRVVQAIDAGEDLMVEAGTGVGKTFAYLVPALLSGKKIIVSTGTRYLQDQIYTKDLPLVMKTLGVSVDVTMLKGRRNYLCRERFDACYSDRQQQLDLQDRDDMAVLRRWVNTTDNGDISNFSLWSESSQQWIELTTSTETCLGSRCSFFDQCFVNHARRRALAADLVVINHHLLLADMVLREEGFGKLLPNTDVVIVDEAHQLREVSENFFGISFSSNQLIGLRRDLHQEEAYKETFPLLQADQSLQELSEQLSAAMQPHTHHDNISVLMKDDNFTAAQKKMQDGLDALCSAIEPLRDYSERLQNAYSRAEALQKNWRTIFDEHDNWISWYRHEQKRFQFHATPMWTGTMLSDKKQSSEACWIYTSATLSVNDDFSYFCRGLGLEADEQTTVTLSSPFDYTRQAALYLPSGLPEPNALHYLDRLFDTSLPLLKMAQGGVFFLLTSHRAVRILADKLRPKFPHLMVQGEAPKIDLIRRFSADPHAILLATAGFWEGVDVRGPSLRCVIIDRLPFASPADPLVRGRARSVQQEGGNYFAEYALPEAVISLRQGVGRLIRGESDKGVIMIGDNRLQTRSYGKTFLHSLPPMTIHKNIKALQPYLAYTAPPPRA